MDFCSWTVFSLDFAKAHFGRKGPALLGRHWGSLEKLGWKSMHEHELTPSEFLKRTYELNWEPMGFKGSICENIENAVAELHVEVNSLADFISKYMAEVSVLQEERAQSKSGKTKLSERDERKYKIDEVSLREV